MTLGSEQPPTGDDGPELSPGIALRCWVVERHIATGGFGSIYRVRHRDSGDIGALKLVHADAVDSAETLARFELEARAIARIRHPGVVRMLDFGELPDGRPFLVMEYLGGVDLERYLASAGACSPRRALDILAPLAEALATAHAHEIIHRDVKASNVMLVPGPGGVEEASRTGEWERVVLLDFGIAKLLESDALDLTSSRARVGSATAMAPEQSKGQRVDARTDVYALGAVAYHLLTGQAPFSAGSLLVAEFMHMRAARPRPSDAADVSPEIDEVVMTAMAIDPDQRYPGTREFLAAFRAAVGAAISKVDRAVVCPAAFGLFLHVWADDDALDDAVFDDAESIVARAVPRLDDAGLRETGRAGNSAMFFCPLPEDDAEPGDEAGSAAAMRARLVDAALALLDALARRDNRADGVHVGVYLHVDAAAIERGELVGGPLHALSGWAHAHPVAAVVATEPVIAGLPVAREQIADDPALWRLAR